MLADDLAAGRTTSEALTQACLAAIEDPAGEGSRAFISVDRPQALRAARQMDALRARGAAPSRYAGIPISIKDLFDVAGQRTRAGAAALADAPPARETAPAVARLLDGGFVPVGRTNMSEFAFSGLGLNPHFGTPRNPWRRAEGFVPGGSTSGGAVSITDDMAHATLGTDTGGSCRIPAAFTGLVGFKPTAARVPREGTVPLSVSLDSVGPIGRSVACCAVMDAILSGSRVPHLGTPSLAGLRLGVPTTFVLDGMDASTATAFARALKALSDAGAQIEEMPVPEFSGIPAINAKGGFAAAQSHAWHRPLIATSADRYDPRILARILRGQGQSAADYIDLLVARRVFIAKVSLRIAGFDAIAFPTVPIAPPAIATVEDDAAFAANNLLVLRNPAVINLLDGCAISLPMHRPGDAPAGLMLAGGGGRDLAILQIAAAVEAVLRA